MHKVSLAGLAFASPPGKGMLSWCAIIGFAMRSWLSTGPPSAEKKSSLICNCLGKQHIKMAFSRLSSSPSPASHPFALNQIPKVSPSELCLTGGCCLSVFQSSHIRSWHCFYIAYHICGSGTQVFCTVHQRSYFSQQRPSFSP